MHSNEAVVISIGGLSHNYYYSAGIREHLAEEEANQLPDHSY